MIALLQKATSLFYMGYKFLCNVAFLIDSFYEIPSVPSSRILPYVLPQIRAL
jgi:hypothetical protein